MELAMSSAVQELIVRFEQLTEEERRDATREILRRAVPEGYGPLSDEDLVTIAEESFLEMDRREEAP
jgi:hypothetical protein